MKRSADSEWRLLHRVVYGELAIEITKRDRRSYSMKLGRAKLDAAGEVEMVLPFIGVTAGMENGAPNPTVAFPSHEIISDLFAAARKRIEEDVATEFDRWQAEREVQEVAEIQKQRGGRRKFDARAVEEAKAEAHPGYVPKVWG